jgi:hypothetical protein
METDEIRAAFKTFQADKKLREHWDRAGFANVPYGQLETIGLLLVKLEVCEIALKKDRGWRWAGCDGREGSAGLHAGAAGLRFRLHCSQSCEDCWLSFMKAGDDNGAVGFHTIPDSVFEFLHGRAANIFDERSILEGVCGDPLYRFDDAFEEFVAEAGFLGVVPVAGLLDVKCGKRVEADGMRQRGNGRRA